MTRLHADTSFHAPALREGRRRWLQAGAWAVLSLGWMAAGCADAQTGDSVSLDAARKALESGEAVLIDVREPAEHARGVAAGAVLLPGSQFRARMAEVPADASKPVLLICNTSNRSKAALQALRGQGGYGHVRYVEGGMSEWVRRGWPVVEPAAAKP